MKIMKITSINKKIQNSISEIFDEFPDRE